MKIPGARGQRRTTEQEICLHTRQDLCIHEVTIAAVAYTNQIS